MLYLQFERDELIKYEIFSKIRKIRSVRRYQESLWWKLPVLLSSCLKDFLNDNGNDGFRGFYGNFLVFAVVYAVGFAVVFCVFFFSCSSQSVIWFRPLFLLLMFVFCFLFFSLSLNFFH